MWIPVMDESVPAQSAETEYDGEMSPDLESDCTDASEDGVDLEANRASISTTAVTLLMAARLGVGANGLSGLTESVTCLPPLSLTPANRRLIDADVHRRASVMKRAPAPQSNPLRTTKAGHTLALDGKGPYAAPSLLGSHTYDMLCVDVATSESMIQSTILHTGEEWFDFIEKCVRRHRDDLVMCFQVCENGCDCIGDKIGIHISLWDLHPHQ